MPSGLALAQVTFTQLGNVLSFVASSVMFYLLARDKKSRAQTRPRLLGVLAFWDALTAASKFIAFLPGMSAQGKLFFEISFGDNLSCWSWSWTCCIALHIFLVIKWDIAPDSPLEKRLERYYWLFMLVSMVGVYAPCTIIFLYVEKADVNWEVHESRPFRQYVIVQFVFTLVQYVWIVGAVFAINYCTSDAQHSAAQQYKQQTTRFLFAFILLTVQALAWMIQSLLFGYSSYYLYNFGYQFSYYLPLANALIWGINDGCASVRYRVKSRVKQVKYVLKGKGGHDGVGQMMMADLAHPLLVETEMVGAETAASGGEWSVEVRGRSNSKKISPSQKRWNVVKESVMDSHAARLPMKYTVVELQWQQAQESLRQKKWAEGVKHLRLVLGECQDDQRMQQVVSGSEKRIGWLLSYALYMQADNELRLGAGTDQAIALLQESLELIRTFEINFSGRINPTTGAEETCVVSFPGKYMDVWTELVRGWDQSIACVFFPEGSVNFGKHCYPDGEAVEERAETKFETETSVSSPSTSANEHGHGRGRGRGRKHSGGSDHDGGEGVCYCAQLYGERKDWGCKWFEAWKSNVQLSVARGHTLRVYYFKHEVGKGKIAWADVAAQSQKRDRVLSKMSSAVDVRLTEDECHCIEGLGGSQKAEVAWLDMMGYAYEEDCIGHCSGELELSQSGRRATNAVSSSMTMTATEWRTKVQKKLNVAQSMGSVGFFSSSSQALRVA